MQIRILAGSQAGRQMVFDQSPITFGRGAHNTLVFDLPFVSREHGQLRYEADQWQVVNQAGNPVVLNRKTVKKGPRPAGASGTLTLGGQALFSYEQQPTSPTALSPTAIEPTQASRVTGRQKLWIGIGVYLLVMLGLVIFFTTLSSQDAADRLLALAPLDAQQIADEIAAPLGTRAPDPRRVQAALEEVATMLALQETQADALFRAHQAYQQAVAYTARGVLAKPLDVRNHYVIQRRLTQEVQRLYERAHSLLRQRQYHNASDAYRKLLDTYPAGNDSQLVQAAQQEWALARRETSRR